MEILQIPIIPHNANYAYILHDAQSGETAMLDPGDAKPMLEILAQKGWSLDYILNTHHHWDHTDGNSEVKAATGCRVIGYAHDSERIPVIDQRVDVGEEIKICGTIAKVMFLPGHTRGHIAYYFEEEKALFSGDVIFAMGCGRLFEGTPQQMYQSFQQLKALPDDTRVYCAHEYTLTNATFATAVLPENHMIQTRYQEVKRMRENNLPTIPTTIGLERETNPFMLAENIKEFTKFRETRNTY